MVLQWKNKNNKEKGERLKCWVIFASFQGRLDIFAKKYVDAFFRGFLQLLPTRVIESLCDFGHFYLSAQINQRILVYGNNWKHKFLDFSTKIIWATIELFWNRCNNRESIYGNNILQSWNGHFLDKNIWALVNLGLQWCFIIPLMLWTNALGLATFVTIINPNKP